MAVLPPLPFNVEPQVNALAAKIKLALFDVDGVLTDGKLHYAADGEQVKIFHAHDGHGLKMLQAAGIEVGVISARQSLALKTRLDDLGIKHCHLGVGDKQSVFLDMLSQMNISSQACAFTGDDVIDLPVMNECGLKLTVANAHFIVREQADWVAPLNGGQGAVRAICDMILYAQNKYPNAVTGQ